MEKITDLLLLPVFNEEGDFLGRVLDLRCAGEPEHGASTTERVVTEILYGKRGVFGKWGYQQKIVFVARWESVKLIAKDRIIIESPLS